jgi:signal transduction histidine kinase
MIISDEARIMQVLLNLQFNALKFTKDGRVTIIVEIIKKSFNEE